jgi:hypothetical protein
MLRSALGNMASAVVESRRPAAQSHDLRWKSCSQTFFVLLLTFSFFEASEYIGEVWSTLPVGWLIDEEFDSLSLPPDPAVSPGEILLKTHVAMGRLMVDRGFERRCGRLLFKRLRERGLVSTGAEARMFMVQSESPGAALVRANYEQLRADLIGAGYTTQQEFEEDLALGWIVLLS